jgi:hypothetical protein
MLQEAETREDAVQWDGQDVLQVRPSLKAEQLKPLVLPEHILPLVIHVGADGEQEAYR